MDIKNIVLHHIKREDNNEPVLTLADHLFPTSDSVVNEFVSSLVKTFSSKSPTYGEFQSDQENYRFQKYVKTYLSEGDFLEFTKDAMSLLKKDIRVPQAKGGYVVFCHYVSRNEDFLLTSMLEKTEEFGINDSNLDLKKLLVLNIENMARANRLNISKWTSDKDLYLSFIKGKRDVSEFFQNFIGNTDLTSSKLNSKNLKDAVDDFMRKSNYNEMQKAEVYDNLSGYFDNQLKKEEDIELASVSALINPESPNEFSDHTKTNDDLNVSGSFRLGRKEDYKFYKKARVKGKGYTLEFERNLVRDKIIVRDSNNIVIKNVPKEILDKEFGVNESG